jgi:hypothetical protein
MVVDFWRLGLQTGTREYAVRCITVDYKLFATVSADISMRSMQIYWIL